MVKPTPVKSRTKGKSQSVRGIAKAKGINNQRTKRARTMDAKKTSKHTLKKPSEKNIKTWASNPRRMDLRNVDTQKAPSKPKKPKSKTLVEKTSKKDLKMETKAIEKTKKEFATKEKTEALQKEKEYNTLKQKRAETERKAPKPPAKLANPEPIKKEMKSEKNVSTLKERIMQEFSRDKHDATKTASFDVIQATVNADKQNTIKALSELQTEGYLTTTYPPTGYWTHGEKEYVLTDKAINKYFY